MALPFLFYPQNKAFLSKKQPYPHNMPSYATAAEWLIFLVFAAVIGVQVLIAASFIYQQIALNQSDYTEGTIIGIDTFEDFEGTSCWTTYSYTVEDKTYTVKKDFCIYDFEVGQKIKVRYALSDPSLSQIDNGRYAQNDLVSKITTLMIAILLTGAIALFILIRILQNNRKTKELRLKGRVVRAQLLEIHSKTDSDDDFWVEAVISFTAPDTGKQVEKRYEKTRNDLKDIELPKPGDTLAVFYGSENNWLLL